MGKKRQITLESLDAKIDRVIGALLIKADTKRIDELGRKVDRRFQDVMGAIDKLAKTISDLTMKYAAVKMQLARHEEWIQLLAKKSGIKLPL
jgi:hypothetical protein